MKRAQRRNRRQGFTLMEVLLVLAILVILGALVVTNFSGVFSGAKRKLAENQINALGKNVELYMIDVGSYPSTNQGLQSLRTPPPDLANPAKWMGPYAAGEIPLDPWDREYIYEYDPTTNQYKIYSGGPDGSPGSADDITKVFN